MQKMPLINCQSLIFSPQLSENRLAQALEAFGLGVVQRLLCYALYLLGLNRSAIGQTLGMVPERAKSIIKAISKEGLVAFEDRRRSCSTFLPQAPAPPPPVTLREEEGQIVVDLGIKGRSITLSRKDPLQLKTVLLSMMNSGLVSTQQVAEAIPLTLSYTTALARRLQDKGALSLVDQRQGQKRDYRVAPSVKAELIQQFAVDVITRGRTSSRALSEEIRKRCRIAVPDRTIRHHLSRLGLGEITRSLPQLVAALKKTSTNGSSS
jgi:DNA-binding MarR family transcriptional regulator